MRGATRSGSPQSRRRPISIHAPHAGRDPRPGQDERSNTIFQSTRPMRGATARSRASRESPTISIHAPHAGRDLLKLTRTPGAILFQSTRPMRGATSVCVHVRLRQAISIHAPHAGRDLVLDGGVIHLVISIHAPHAGRDDATEPSNGNSDHFNPRAPCGARHSTTGGSESDVLFQSTRPMRGATSRAHRRGRQQRISIHAPHAGRDALRSSGSRHRPDFNPRAPCGARLVTDICKRNGIKFQSTRPMRGATAPIPSVCVQIVISIHAPHAGRDQADATGRDIGRRFQSTRPMRGATTAPSPASRLWLNFNPRAPCGARRAGAQRRRPYSNFNPRAPCGARPRRTRRRGRAQNFNPRAPCGARPSSWSSRAWQPNFNPRAPCGARHAARALSLTS